MMRTAVFALLVAGALCLRLGRLERRLRRCERGERLQRPFLRQRKVLSRARGVDRLRRRCCERGQAQGQGGQLPGLLPQPGLRYNARQRRQLLFGSLPKCPKGCVAA